MKQRYLIAFLFVSALVIMAIPAFAAQNILTWDDVANETTYHIERKTEACAGTGAFTEIATVGQNVVTYTDTAVAEGSTYCYRVAASNAAGKSGYSNTAGRTVPFSVPTAPTNLRLGGG